MKALELNEEARLAGTNICTK